MIQKSLPALWLVISTLAVQADVQFSKPFTSHMVLQREMPVPIWGQAAPGEVVNVEFRDQKKSATADEKGKWMVRLDALKPGGPDTLTANGQKLEDVLVGDVWLGSGQSNMAISTKSFVTGDPVLAANAKATYPKLRLLGNGWHEATPETINGFSALCFSFGLPLQREIEVPVGLMVAAVGGTPSGYWLTDGMYRSDAACAASVKEFEAKNSLEARTQAFQVAQRKYESDLAAWQTKADQAKADGKPVPQGPRKPAPLTKPGESSGQIGNLFEKHVRPLVGFAIKGVLWDQGEAGTSITGVNQYVLMGALIRGWRLEWGQGEFPFLYVEKPSGGGTAWDLNDPVTNKAEPFTPPPAQVPLEPTTPYTHELHLRIMGYPKTYMVTSTDLGRNTHPTNKSGYGVRASRVALSTVYGRTDEYYGPLYASHEIRGSEVTIKFTHVGKGLAPAHSPTLQGFAIAGEDKKFVWADAKIVGDTVVVSKAEVPKPVAVRYAWNNLFPWANLFNQDGLPAQPFRSDR